MSIWASFSLRLEISLPQDLDEINYLQWDPEFVTEDEKTRMTLNPIPGSTLHNMIVEG